MSRIIIGVAAAAIIGTAAYVGGTITSIDQTPPLGHGREKLPAMNGGGSTSVKKPQKPSGPPAALTSFRAIELVPGRKPKLFSRTVEFRHTSNTTLEKDENLDVSAMHVRAGEVVATCRDGQPSYLISLGCQITPSKGAITQVVVDKQNNATIVRALHKNTTVYVNYYDPYAFSVELRDGQEISVPIFEEYEKQGKPVKDEDIQRTPTRTNFVQAYKASPLLQQLDHSTDAKDQQIFATIEKTVAALRQIRGQEHMLGETQASK
jgi:hypothetical protein